MLELQPDIAIPGPPPPIARPAVPITPTDFHVDADVTIDPVTFDLTVPIVEMQPPAATASDEDISKAPRFTPYSVAPRLLNRGKIQRELERRYERLGRIEGRVIMWFFIDEEGVVKNAMVKEPSEFERLNKAALEVAKLMRFAPALNRDKRVPAWVALPIRFVQQ